MTERRNYYEIIDQLAFDPVEKNDKKIKNAINLWKFRKEQEGISQEEPNGERRQKELAMYNDIMICLTNPQSRKAEADAMKQMQKNKLDAVIAVMKESGDGEALYVTDACIRKIAESFRLDWERTVKEAFMDAGFEIIVRERPVNILNDILLSEIIFDRVVADVKKLSCMNSKDFPWLSKVKNLYDLAAYFNHDGENARIYYLKPAAELKHIMEAGSVSVHGKLDEVSHCLCDLFAAGFIQIFKDENTKTKYDNSLKREKLRDLFSLLKEMPKEIKKNAHIAYSFIKKIQVFFPDPNVALAIYNKEAGLGMDPYIP